MKRRDFLKHSFHAAAVPSVIASMGFTMPGQRAMQQMMRQAAETDKVLVMIFLVGGNDGLNTIVPLDRLSELNALRPKVVLNDNSLLPLHASDVAMHPSMPDLRSLYHDGRFQIIQNVGYPDQNFSHFRSTDIWMSGSSAHDIVPTGWMGRQLTSTYEGYPDAFPTDDMKDPLSVEIGFGTSLLFQGDAGSTSVSVESVDSFYELINNVEQPAPGTLAGDKLKFLRLISRQSQQYGQRIVEVAEKVSQHVEYPEDNYLADQLKIVSKLIAGGSRTPVYLVRLNEFDTHDSQVDDNHNEGIHANLLRMLNDAIKAFMEDLEFHGLEEKVLGMTFSEFGRTILSNASNGTDHGAAAPMFFFGNVVKGGIVGSNPVLDRHMTYADNLPYAYDFRQLYASVLEQWFELDTTGRNDVMMGDYETVPIVGGSSVILDVDEPASNPLSVYPNPLSEMATVRFEGDGEEAAIDLMDMHGRSVGKIFHGRTQASLNQVQWNTTSLRPGRYFVVLQSARGKQVFSVVK